MSEPLTIRKIIERVTSGDIRIPAFQRGYVWKPDQVAFLLDSLYKEYPIGTVFLWKTDVRLKNEKNLGNFTLPAPRKDYPVNYVLDGQQRITSLFSVFQTELEPSGNLEWLEIYYDLGSDVDIQESNFLALPPESVDAQRHFPMRTLFDSVKYRAATKRLTSDQVKQVDKLQEKFKEVLIPVQEFETDDREKVAIVFERINRAGTELDTYQLLTAWSWSEEFDLIEEMDALSRTLAGFGYDEFARNRDLQLKCFSGFLKKDARPKALFDLNGSEVRENFEALTNGIKSAVDFLRTELGIYSFDWLPYPAMLVSLVSFFATSKKSGKRITDNQRKELIRWFWVSNFGRRYSAGVNRIHETDLAQLNELRDKPSYKISLQAPVVDAEFFLDNTFNVSATNSKTFVALLASRNPISFISGAKVHLDEVLKDVNRNEFHHIFPKKYLERINAPAERINCLTNFCFLSSGDNQKIKDRSPKEYKKLISKPTLPKVLDRSFCPRNALDLKFEDFSKLRAGLLAAAANDLMKR